MTLGRPVVLFWAAAEPELLQPASNAPVTTAPISTVERALLPPRARRPAAVRRYALAAPGARDDVAGDASAFGELILPGGTVCRWGRTGVGERCTVTPGRPSGGGFGASGTGPGWARSRATVPRGPERRGPVAHVAMAGLRALGPVRSVWSTAGASTGHRFPDAVAPSAVPRWCGVMTVVPDHRCGAAPELNRVPCCPTGTADDPHCCAGLAGGFCGPSAASRLRPQHHRLSTGPAATSPPPGPAGCGTGTRRGPRLPMHRRRLGRSDGVQKAGC